MKRKIQVFLRDIFLPLLLGLCIYLLFYKNTYINTFLGVEVNIKTSTFLGVVIKSWVCDFLWTYALANALYLCLFAFENKVILSAILSMLFATTFELLQLVGLVAGTFDILDIIFQFVAVLIAVALIKRREKV